MCSLTKNVLKILRYCKMSVSLQCFHGIRFKVNKGWDSAEPLFCALTFHNTSFYGHFPVVMATISFYFVFLHNRKCIIIPYKYEDTYWSADTRARQVHNRA